MSTDLKHVYKLMIEAPPEKVWEALTNSEYTTRFWYGSAISSEWTSGSDYKITTADGSRVFIHGKVLEADRPRRLVQTYNTTWPPFDTEKETTMTWELEPRDGGTQLTLTHEGFQDDSKLYETLAQGWTDILNGLKAILETGRPAAAPAAQ